MTQTLITADQREIVEKADSDAAHAFQVAQDLVVTDDATMHQAADMLSQIATAKKEINDKRLAMTRPLDAAKKQIMQFFSGPLERLTSAEKHLKGQVSGYQGEQRRLAEQRALEERRRIEQNAAKRAERAEQKGDEHKAAEIRRDAEVDAALVPVAPTPTAAGVSTRQLWRGRVTDMQELCAAIGRGEAPAHLVKPDQSAINKIATAQRDVARVPGVIFYAEESVAVRSL